MVKFLRLNNISVMYQPGQYVLEKFNLCVEKGKFLSLLGPSGCGKTTTLRTIAGFIALQEGTIVVNNKIYNNVPINKRNIGLVFQNYALFPHLNVFDNVAFGLKMRKIPKDLIKEKVLKVIESVGLNGYEKRLPAQLSGGQQQRIGIARAVVVEPDLLLMDEPLSNLDAKLRIEMRAEIRRLQKKLKITTIYVTHDQLEAIALSDEIAVLNQGKIEQTGTPEEIFYSPKTLYVAKFIGFQEIVSGIVVNELNDFVEVSTEYGIFKAKKTGKVSLNSKVSIVARKKDFTLDKKENTNSMRGKIIAKIFQGDVVLYMVKTGSNLVQNVEIPLKLASWEENEKLNINVNPEACIAFSEGGK